MLCKCACYIQIFTVIKCFAAIDLVSTVIGDQVMHLNLVKEFIDCGKLKQARRLVEVVFCSLSSTCHYGNMWNNC